GGGGRGGSSWELPWQGAGGRLQNGARGGGVPAPFHRPAGNAGRRRAPPIVITSPTWPASLTTRSDSRQSPMHQLLKVALLAVLAAVLAVIIWGLDRGFDITDESMVLLLYQHPDAYPVGFSMFYVLIDRLV